MKAPPCDQNQERADDSKNKPFRHFFTYLVRMGRRL